MTKEQPRHRMSGMSVTDRVKGWADELTTDEVGFWQIVPEARKDFRLAGVDLDEFVRLSLLALFERGAIPLRHVRASGHVWTWQTSYYDRAMLVA